MCHPEYYLAPETSKCVQLQPTQTVANCLVHTEPGKCGICQANFFPVLGGCRKVSNP